MATGREVTASGWGITTAGDSGWGCASIHQCLSADRQMRLGAGDRQLPQPQGLVREQKSQKPAILLYFLRNKNVNVIIKQKKITSRRAGEVAAGVKLPFNLISEAAQVPLKTTVVTLKDTS